MAGEHEVAVLPETQPPFEEHLFHGLQHHLLVGRIEALLNGLSRLPAWFGR